MSNSPRLVGEGGVGGGKGDITNPMSTVRTHVASSAARNWSVSARRARSPPPPSPAPSLFPSPLDLQTQVGQHTADGEPISI